MSFQPSLPGFASEPRIINVASVPQRSPFRYPGGKTWLVPYLRRWAASLPQPPTAFLEPFAGGGSIGLTAAFEELAHHITLVELDRQVAAVWETIITEGEGPWLADQILQFVLTPQHVDALLAQEAPDTRTLALQTIVQNRVNRGGILAKGAGRVKTGEAGKGLTSRWYPETLSRRISDIHAIRHRLTFVQADGLLILEQFAPREDALFFIDPPYTAAGKKAGQRLYTHSQIDHVKLFDTAAHLKSPFLMTYDDNETIRHLAAHFGFETAIVPMKNTHHLRQTELLISKDLAWLS